MANLEVKVLLVHKVNGRIVNIMGRCSDLLMVGLMKIEGIGQEGKCHTMCAFCL